VLESGGDGSLRVDQPADLDEVDASLANEAPDRANLGHDAGDVAQMYPWVGHGPEAMECHRDDLDAPGAQPIGCIPGLVGQQHDRLPAMSA